MADEPYHPRGLEPLGRRRYWPVLEACAANGFSIALHLGGTSGHPSTGGGYAFKVKLPEREKQMVFRDNALAFYGLQ